MAVADASTARYDLNVTELRRRTDDIRKAVLGHPIYSALNSLDALRTFMETHVFAVWDFMSLLKRLQQQLTCTTVPWVPSANPLIRRLINEIVLVEESDRCSGGYASHFELYLKAMRDAGADTSAVTDFLTLVRLGRDPVSATRAAGSPLAARNFVAGTWALVTEQPLHCQAAAFAFGREDLVPRMFEQVLRTDDSVGRLDAFRLYLRRHIEVDGGDHGPMAMAMMAELCGDDQAKWNASTGVVASALKARAEMWTGIVDSLDCEPQPSRSDRLATSIRSQAASLSAAIRSVKLLD